MVRANAFECFESEQVVVIGNHTQFGTHSFWTSLFDEWEDQKIDLSYDGFIHDNVSVPDGSVSIQVVQAKTPRSCSRTSRL